MSVSEKIGFESNESYGITNKISFFKKSASFSHIYIYIYAWYKKISKRVILYCVTHATNQEKKATIKQHHAVFL